MKINVLHNYGGWNTQERRILPGVYDSEDAALFGLAQYLVDNGHAVIAGEIEPVQVVEVEPQTQSVGADETITELIPVNPPLAPEQSPIEMDVTNRPKVKRKKS